MLTLGSDPHAAQGQLDRLARKPREPPPVAPRREGARQPTPTKWRRCSARAAPSVPAITLSSGPHAAQGQPDRLARKPVSFPLLRHGARGLGSSRRQDGRVAARAPRHRCRASCSREARMCGVSRRAMANRGRGGGAHRMLTWHKNVVVITHTLEWALPIEEWVVECAAGDVSG